jgi:hypothetical protein
MVLPGLKHAGCNLVIIKLVGIQTFMLRIHASDRMNHDHMTPIA